MAPSTAQAEITVGWGEDTNCVDCGCLLPAGAPAWPDSDGRVVCVGCVGTDNPERGR